MWVNNNPINGTLCILDLVDTGIDIQRIIAYILQLINSMQLLEKLIVTQLVNKFPAFYVIQRFIDVFTGTRHWSLS